jgi:hypothetical protein
LKQKIIKPLLIAISLNLTAVGVSFATITESSSAASMVEKSNACVIARAISSESETIKGQTFTRTEFEITDVAFGDVQAIISLLTPGGSFQKGKLKIAEVVPGLAPFSVGKKHMLFLKTAADGKSFILTDYGQSTFQVNDNIVALPQNLGGGGTPEQVIERINALRNQ